MVNRYVDEVFLSDGNFPDFSVLPGIQVRNPGIELLMFEQDGSTMYLFRLVFFMKGRDLPI